MHVPLPLHCLLCLIFLFFVDLFTFLFLILSHAFFASLFCFILFCTSSFYHHVSLSLFCFPNVSPSTVLAVFLAFPLFYSSRQVTNPCIPESWSKRLFKRFLTACLLQFPPPYLWLYFLRLFLFHQNSHFAYHNTVLLCDALIYHYLTIAHFLQVHSSAHHIIYLGISSVTFVGHPVLSFLK